MKGAEEERLAGAERLRKCSWSWGLSCCNHRGGETVVHLWPDVLHAFSHVKGETADADCSEKKRIYNPVTGKYYEIRQHSSKYGTAGQIKGLWSSKKKKSSK